MRFKRCRQGESNHRHGDFEPFNGNERSKGNLFLAGREKNAPGNLGAFQGYHGFEKCFSRCESPSKFYGQSILLSSLVGIGRIHGEIMPIEFPIGVNQFL
jgi:hypothetical protein